MTLLQLDDANPLADLDWLNGLFTTKRLSFGNDYRYGLQIRAGLNNKGVLELLTSRESADYSLKTEIDIQANMVAITRMMVEHPKSPIALSFRLSETEFAAPYLGWRYRQSQHRQDWFGEISLGLHYQVVASNRLSAGIHQEITASQRWLGNCECLVHEIYLDQHSGVSVDCQTDALGSTVPWPLLDLLMETYFRQHLSKHSLSMGHLLEFVDREERIAAHFIPAKRNAFGQCDLPPAMVA